MLSPLDDYLSHQTPETFDRVASSDRNFYDRYYFNCHDLTGETFLVIAMGVYPNLGVIDAFATCVQRNQRQFNVRASRELGSDRSNTIIGPIGVEVLEGLRLFRVWCEPNEWGLSFDLTFQGITPPFLEPHFLRRAGNRVVMDYTRLTQPGRWHGDLVVGGERHDVRAEGWWGARDHSWGIRPVGDREAGGAPVRDGPRGFFWNWAPLQFDDQAIMYTVSEHHDGSRWHEAAARLYPYDANRAEEKLSVVRHDLRMKPGTRTFDGGRVTLGESSGSEIVLDLEPLSLLQMAGAGYAYQGDLWRHGQYHGELAIDGESWDLTDEALVRRVSGQNETVCRVRSGDRTGYGIFEFILFGQYDPYSSPAPAETPAAVVEPTPAPTPAPEAPPAELRAQTPPFEEPPAEAEGQEAAPDESPVESRAERLVRARRELEQREGTR
jgi:hypothetical protein